ncbi:NAD(P)-binding domain-containing protein [Abortiporus biennis]
MSSKVVTIVGGHGQIALRLAKLLSPTHKVISIIRTPTQIPDIQNVNSTPLILSLETDPVSKFTEVFKNSAVVVFSAGSGGKGGIERTKAVDYEGALKVFDAIEGVEREEKPRLVLVSSIDIRGDPDKFPDHYTDEDVVTSKTFYATLGEYFRLKYEADKNLARRTSFKWTIIRPGLLTNEPGTGKGLVGRTPLKSVSRDDVAHLLALLVDKPEAADMVVEFVNGGDTSIEQALNGAIKSGQFTGWRE